MPPPVTIAEIDGALRECPLRARPASLRLAPPRPAPPRPARASGARKRTPLAKAVSR